VADLLRLDAKADPKTNDFYLLGMSGNGGRLLVRIWLHESLATIKQNVRDWYLGLRIADAFTGEAAPDPKLWQIRNGLARDEPPAHLTLALYRRALLGQPLRDSVLTTLMNRARKAAGNDRLNAARIGLIRLCLNDLEGEKHRMNESLDKAQQHPAYLCGRLLALYEGLQYAAQGKLNQTVADRYYALASTNPAIAFPRVVQLGEAHSKKLRRDNWPAMVSINREIQGVMEQLAEQSGARFPDVLALRDQGRFAIGFHHQRAENMTRARERKQQKETEGEEQNNG
jgi:CRISPR-associated protein Csd1